MARVRAVEFDKEQQWSVHTYNVAHKYSNTILPLPLPLTLTPLAPALQAKTNDVYLALLNERSVATKYK